MIRSKIILTFLMVVLFIKMAISQSFWEVLPIPDTIKATSIAVNVSGDIFLSTCSTEYVDGIFKSHNGGYNWEKVFDAGQNSIISLAISDSGVLYALGTFEGIDLLKSTDNGLTWSVLPVPDSYLNQKIFLKGEDTIFVSQWGDAAVLLRSVDGGLNWEQVFNNNYGVQYVIDMAFSTEGEIYIGLMCYSVNSGGIYKSSDGGQTWDFLGLQNHQVSSISIDSSNNLLITVWSNMIDIGISGNYCYNHNTNEFSSIYFAWEAYGSAINTKNEYFTTFNSGTLHSIDEGLTYNMMMGDTAAGCELYLTKDNYIYGLGQFSNYLVKTIKPTVTAVSNNRYESQLLTISPNPVKDRLNGRVSLNLSKTYTVIEIIDVTGKCLINSQVEMVNDCFSIDVSKIKSGFYLVQLCSNGLKYSTTFVKN